MGDEEIPSSGTDASVVVVGNSLDVAAGTVSAVVVGAGNWLVVVVNSVLDVVLLDEVVLV